MKKLNFTVLLVILNMLTFGSTKEHIKFNLKFGFIKGGEAELMIYDTLFNLNKAKHYYLVGRTTGITDKLFGVNDIYETTVDSETLLPLKAIRNVKEGRYRSYNETLFFHDNDSIYSQKNGGERVPENLLDIVSIVFYFAHNHLDDDLNPGSSLIFPTYHAGKISDIKVKYVGNQKVKTTLGEIDCFLLIPTVDKGRVLKKSDGLKVYISRKSKLPIMFEFDMRVGTLRAELESISTL